MLLYQLNYVVVVKAARLCNLGVVKNAIARFQSCVDLNNNMESAQIHTHICDVALQAMNLALRDRGRVPD